MLTKLQAAGNRSGAPCTYPAPHWRRRLTTTGDSMLKQLMPAIALATAAFCAAQPALAQSAGTYPNKPIHIIVTFTSGGAPDILGRLIGEKLSAAWGQPVIVDNKP